MWIAEENCVDLTTSSYPGGGLRGRGRRGRSGLSTDAEEEKETDRLNLGWLVAWLELKCDSPDSM